MCVCALLAVVEVWVINWCESVDFGFPKKLRPLGVLFETVAIGNRFAFRIGEKVGHWILRVASASPVPVLRLGGDFVSQKVLGGHHTLQKLSFGVPKVIAGIDIVF